MNDKLTDVIRRVHKLLSVANSSDKPGEVAAAQSLAQSLITKYQIEEAQLRGSSMGYGIISKTVFTPSPYTIDKSTLLNSIALANFCKVLRGDDYCIIYGYESDIDLSIVLYDMLSIHMVSEMHTKLKHKKYTSTEDIDSRAWTKSFFAGYTISSGNRMKEAKDRTISEVDSTGTSLAVVLRNKQHEIEDYWQRLVRNTSTKRVVTSASGYAAGSASAQEANLNQQPIESE